MSIDIIEMQLVKLQRDLARAIDARRNKRIDELEAEIESLQVQYDNALDSIKRH